MANRRFEVHDYRQIIVRIRLGESDRQIRDAGLCGRKKAAELRRIAGKQGWLDVTQPLPENPELVARIERPAPRPSQESSVAPFRSWIEKWHRQGIQGTVIHRALVDKHGYAGSYSAVRRYLQKLDRAAGPETATTWLEFAPGEAAQVDFGKGPEIVDVKTGEAISSWFFVMTLAWSRHQYVEFVRDQKVETWLGCHHRAFQFFGGVPEKVVIDNAKCAIVRACFHDPTVQRSYAEFAEGYGFKIAPCPPRDPKKKGRVESGVKYVKRNFVPLRSFRGLSDANEQARKWVLETAGTRTHGTTKEKPLDLFESEREFLKKLPDQPPILASWAKVRVHGNCHVQHQKCYYSVPYRLVHQTLWLKATETSVQLYRDHELVAVHGRKHRPGDRSTVRDHLPPPAVAYLMRDPTWCRIQAERVGPSCQAVIETLFSDRVLDRLTSAQGILRLAERFGAERLEAACRRALLFDARPGYRKLKTILEKNLESLGVDEGSPQGNLDLNPVYTGSGTFCRDSRTLLN